MLNRWKEAEAKKFKSNLLALRVYTSRLLGQEPDLVLHGGGNTSVKTRLKNIFSDFEDIIYVKGSGWDLATIESGGFAPVRLDALKRMVRLKKLSDTEMVRLQRTAMTDPNAPTPSVEAILHAIIPFRFVDHTHADSVVALTNSPHGEKIVREIYQDRVLIVPYVMPGFILARKIYEMTKTVNWNKLEGMVLLNHGIFSFHDEARISYGRMIRLVSKAENYLKRKAHVAFPASKPKVEPIAIAMIRQSVSKIKGSPMLAQLRSEPVFLSFSNLKNVHTIATRGPLTPDHLIRTKPSPVILGKNPEADLRKFAENYRKYFQRNTNGRLTCLDPAPRWAVWPKRGVVVFGSTRKEMRIVGDIVEHTITAIRQAEALGGWKPLPEKKIFEMEYWELEQAKMKKQGKPPAFQGKVVIVSGAASGIGRACVEMFAFQGACVAALDINPKIREMFLAENILGISCDVSDESEISLSIKRIVQTFGGIDILISNAGIFPLSEKIADLQSKTWQKSLQVNLTSHQILLKACVPYLSCGMEPAVVVIGSKNIPAPGPGVAAYSVAKAGLMQLARVAALELAGKGIRVNVIHPNQVFDTAIWTREVLKKRAKHYGLSVEGYKKNNLLRTEITSKDVASLVCTVAGLAFLKTTGAQIPIDGGNDRVI